MTTRNRKNLRPGKAAILAIGLGLGLAVALLKAVSPAAAAPPENALDILIVANRNISTSTVSIKVVRDLFLKVRKSWNDGSSVLPINAKDETLRDEFRTRVLEMDAAAEKRHWEDQKLRYGQREPASFSEPLKAVFKLKGAVSYVYRKDYKEGVAKVLLEIPAHPPQP